MADNAIKNLLKRLQVMEDSSPNPKPTGPSGEALPKKLGSASLGIDKLKVKGGNASNLEAKPDPSHIKGMDGAKPAAQVPFDVQKNLEFDTGTELSEADFGMEDEDEEAPPDFSGDDADLDSDLDDADLEDGDDDLDSEDVPLEDGGEGEDDVDATLAHIEDLLRDAMGDETLSVSVGVNLPKGEEGEGEAEPDADDIPEDSLDDATVPEEPGLEGEDEEDEFGADQATMESFLKEFTGSQKKNSNEDEDSADSGESDSDDESKDEDDNNPFAGLGNGYVTRGY